MQSLPPSLLILLLDGDLGDGALLASIVLGGDHFSLQRSDPGLFPCGCFLLEVFGIPRQDYCQLFAPLLLLEKELGAWSRGQGGEGCDPFPKLHL